MHDFYHLSMGLGDDLGQCLANGGLELAACLINRDFERSKLAIRWGLLCVVGGAFKVSTGGCRWRNNAQNCHE